MEYIQEFALIGATCVVSIAVITYEVYFRDYDLQSAEAAVIGGATSLELCSNRSEGGTTPSIGLVEQCAERFAGSNVQLNVLVRPRPGGFHYTSAEQEVIKRDVMAIRSAGADGIVFGALKEDGTIDESLMNDIRKLAYGIQITFHRAIDVCNDSNEVAFAKLRRIGCNRLLTSGRAPTACEGFEELIKMVELSNNDISVVAGSGINANNVKFLCEKTQVHGIHMGKSVTKIKFEKKLSSENSMLGSNDMNQWECVDSLLVANVIAIAFTAWDVSRHIMAAIRVFSNSNLKAYGDGAEKK